MKNIAFTHYKRTATRLWVHAAKLIKCVSRLLRELLRQGVSDTRKYDEAMRRFQAIKPFDAEWVSGRRPTREELYADRT